MLTITNLISAELGSTMIYISTDYVFDGTKPPYAETDKPNPLNTYGRTKLQGEEVTLKASQGRKHPFSFTIHKHP